MGGGGEQQQVAGLIPQFLPQLEPLGLSQVRSVLVGGHFVGFVHYHQIPFFAPRGLFQFRLQFLVAGQLVQAGDEQVFFQERVGGEGRLHHLPGENLKAQVELVVQLLLPLLHQRTGGHHQATEQGAPQHQLPDVKAGHDGFAGPRVVGQQKSQRLEGQQFLVDGLDLVGQRVDAGGFHGGERVEQVGQPDAPRLGGQPEQVAVGIERPPPVGGHRKPEGVLGGHQPLPQCVVKGPVNQRPHLIVDQIEGHHLHRPVGPHPRQPHARLDLAKKHRNIP